MGLVYLDQYLGRYLLIVHDKDNVRYPQPNDDSPMPPPTPVAEIKRMHYPIPDLPGQVLRNTFGLNKPADRLYKPSTSMVAVGVLVDTLRWVKRSDTPSSESGPYRIFNAIDTKILYMAIANDWTMVATLKHALLDGLLEDQHPQYLNTTRHDLTSRHGLGTVVPHDSHNNLSNIGTNTHAQIDEHIASESNPHNVTASQAGALPDLHSDTLPVASESYRGKFYLLEGDTDVADILYVCTKKADNSYDWLVVGIT